MTDEPMGIDDMISRPITSDDPLTNATVEMINILTEVFSHLRSPETAPRMEGVIIAACVTYAGCLHGELMALGMTRDFTDDALREMLATNFHAGQHAGEQKVARLRPAFEREQTGQGPVPS